MIRWLVAGVGQAGRCHIAAIDKTGGAILAGIIDPHGPTEASAPIYADLSAALKSADADAIVIAAPNDTQAGLVQLALESGLPVLCEKPVGKTHAEARALNTQATENGVPLGVVLNQRAQIQSRWIHELIKSGALTPRTVTFTGDLARLTGWHADPVRSGGGVLRTIGLHYIDLVLWWLGAPSEVEASLTGAPQEDCIDIALGFSSGCRARIKLDAVKERATGPVRCVIEGDGTTIEMVGHSITAVDGLPQPPDPEESDADLFFGPGHLTVIAEATAALETGLSFPVPLAEVFPALDVVEDIYDKNVVE